MAHQPITLFSQILKQQDTYKKSTNLKIENLESHNKGLTQAQEELSQQVMDLVGKLSEANSLIRKFQSDNEELKVVIFWWCFFIRLCNLYFAVRGTKKSVS